METAPNASSRTQEFISVDSASDGVILMKDKSLRAVLLVSSLNFALKSPQEQDATIFQYQNFLNSLDFSLQIVVQSRRLNIKPYLEILEKETKSQTNELLRMQTKEYIEFIRAFVQEAKIVSKNFFVIIPFTPTMIQQKHGLLQSILGKKPAKEKEEAEERLEEYKSQLFQRVDVVVTGLQRAGLRAVPLNTDELIELIFRAYNPSETERQAPKTTT